VNWDVPAVNLQSLQHILTAQMISSVHEGELCRSLRYLAEFTELTEAEVNNLPDEARSFVLAALPNEEAGNALQLTSPTYLNMFTSDLNFSVKNTKQYTRHILYDGLGPDYHFLLDHKWFAGQAAHLADVASLEQVNSTDTAVRLKKR
jgi:hypothetical protein